MLLVHAADLHLDSPLSGLERYPGAPVEAIRGATRTAFQALVTACLSEGADLLVIAGDVYDGDWKDYSTGLFFASELARLRESGAKVALVRGNHDAASQITRHLPLPGHVFEFSSARAESHVVDRIGVALHGRSFRERAVAEDLAAGYPEPIRGLLNVGVLHTSLNGREGHDPYAPSTEHVLRGRGYDYWALGHVHQREVVSEAPYIVYPGNLQGRHARELGPKGATFVRAEDGRIESVEPRAFDVVRWARCDVDASLASTADDVVELVRRAVEGAALGAEGRVLCAPVDVTGATRAHAALVGDPERWESQIRLAAGEAFGGEAWIERVRFQTSPPWDAERIAARRDAAGQIARALAKLRAEPEELAALFDVFADLKGKLPPEAREGPYALRLDDPALQREVLSDVERLLAPELSADSEEA